jgi:hypothetical protein
MNLRKRGIVLIAYSKAERSIVAERSPGKSIKVEWG